MTVFIRLPLHMHSCMYALSRQVQYTALLPFPKETSSTCTSILSTAYHSWDIIFLGMISSEWPPGVVAGTLPFGSVTASGVPFRRASDHVPTSNHSQPLILYFPQAIRELHFHFAASTLMHCCNPPSGWSTSYTRELKLYLNWWYHKTMIGEWTGFTITRRFSVWIKRQYCMSFHNIYQQ